MKKKLLAGILALALCSTNMLPQTIFAGEFTSGNMEEVSEETSEVFTDNDQESAEETEEELSVFTSESVPEFSNEANVMPATVNGEQPIEINLTTPTAPEYSQYYNSRYKCWIISSGGSYRFNGYGSTTSDPIYINAGFSNVVIYLNNVKIVTDSNSDSALHIESNNACIYLEHDNYLETSNETNEKHTLEIDPRSRLTTINNSSNNNNDSLTVRSIKSHGIYSYSPLIINGGSVTASSTSGIGIGGKSSNITVNGGSVIASSTSGIGIGGEKSNITVIGGSVIASSTHGTGIGGEKSNITVNGGSVTASSARGTDIGGKNSGIIINGGSVKASSVSSSPANAQGEVYCCTISNPQKKVIRIDGDDWGTYNHVNDKDLYAWLTGKTHTISVGDTTQTYYFNKKDNTFVPINFTFAAPRNLVYDGHSKDASLTNTENIGDFTLSYYNEQNELCTFAINAGTYRVRADINNETYTFSDLVNTDWTFTITKANQAPRFPDNNPIFVSWSCKKVGDITNILPENWIWKDTDKSLEVGIPIFATAVYAGIDAGNYVNKSVELKITRSECTHEHTAGRYYSSPSCTSSGYSGDTYCTDCNKTLSYGYTISAYGHDYDSGVITTEPTAETDGIITYTCKRCKHQDTKTLGKLGDGEPYIEGSFQKKGWDAVNTLIRASNEKDTIFITLNGSRTLPASVLSEIKGKDISLNLDMENGFIWKINGTSITAETPADTDLSVTNTAEYIPAALYSLISTNQNDFGFHLGRSGTFDFPAILSVKADASCAGLMANLFWYDAENGVLQCIQTVTVGGAFERSIPYADFTLSKGQDYFIAFGTESLNGRVIHTDGSITDENGAYLRPANTKISSHSIDRNKLTVKLSKGCAGAQGYDFVISKKSNMLQTGKFSQTVSSTGKPQASFRYLAKGTWYVAARSWVLDEQGNKVYGSWTKVKKIKITVVTPQQPKIKNITVKGNTVTITYTKCKNATGYEILLGNKYKTSAGEKYPVKKHLKRTEGKNTVTVTFTNVKKGTWYVTIRAWNQTSKDKSRVYSPYSTMKKFKTKK
ncbi:hypothetical protein [Blautia wexlerae]|uniref:hypothetical protein n=3 Tax=Blautia TaxID=572511 RepID=UPI00321A20B6